MANIALNKFADANSSVFPYTPAKAVDGVLTPLNRWVGSSPLPPEPATPAPNWLRVDLGNTYWINRWVVKQMGSVGWSPNDNLTDYKLQGSLDNANWFDIDSVTNNSANSTDRAVSPRKTRWVRIYITKGLRCNTNFASIVDLEVYDAANAPSLTGLTVQNGATNVPLTPIFSSQTFSYTASVAGDTASVTITPTAAQSNMVIKVNNITVPSGQTSAPVNLNPGVNSIPVTVTSSDGLMTETYTITVTRTSTSAFLTGLLLTARGAVMTPSFDKATLSYTATVASNAASATVTPTAEDPAANIKVNTITVPSGTASGPITLNQGLNTITILVTAVDGSSNKTYTIAVTKP